MEKLVHTIIYTAICNCISLVMHAGTYIDKKCPFTGDISIRGRILSGIVKSTKMNKTIIVRRNYVHYIKKYARYVCKPGVIRQHTRAGSAFRQSALLGSKGFQAQQFA